MENFADTFWFDYILLPLFIIIARIFDVSLNTIRIIYLSKGHRVIVPILGFFEVLIWLLAVTRIFADLSNWVAYLAYPLGFALGNYIGIKIEEKLAVGVELIRIITRRDATKLVQELRDKGFSVTAIKAEGSTGEVGILYSIVNRKNLQDYVNTIKTFNPKAFYTIEDVKFVSQDLLDTRTNLNARKRTKSRY